MRRMHDIHRIFAVVLSAALCAAAGPNGAAQTRPRDRAYPADPPRFTNPQRGGERRAQLATAFPQVDAVFKDFAARARVPGIAYGIVVDGELAHSGAAGYRDIAAKAPADIDTVFRIASMTKSFTAMAILKLRDEGKLALDDAAERYVPELKTLSYPTADSPRITIRHLLTHSEGFPEDNPWGDRQLAVDDGQMGDMMRRGIPFSNAPGVAYEYSNYGFAILGRIVARVSGMPYREYLAAHILKPLGMTATTMEPSSVPPSRIALGYRWEDERWKEEPMLADGAFGAMGGMLTSVRDLSRYVAFHLSAWPPRDEPESGPLRRASLREMQQVWRASPATVRVGRNFSSASGTSASTSSASASVEVSLNAGGYGYGLRVWQTCEFRHVVAHSGGLPGFGSQMRWLPEHGVGIIAFGNRTYTGWGGAIDEAVAALARTGALQPRVAQPSPALTDARKTVTALVQQWDDRLADAVAADNLFLDIAKDRRRRELEELRAKYGACRAEDGFDVENALRGEWTMSCERGKLRVAITLAPTMPPKVQYLVVRPVDDARPVAGTGTCQ